MAEQPTDLAAFYKGWENYQNLLTQAIAPLTSEQLALRAAPGLRSIGENALHVAGCRMFWFAEFLGEDGGEELKAYARWNEAALGAPYANLNEYAQALDAPLPTAAELAVALNRTWQFMSSCLARWSPADLQQTIPVEEDGTPVEVPRSWVVWHVLEHDLHHGGEISLILGIHGIAAIDI